MSDVAIRLDNLGKQYRIGEGQARYMTLRDTLVKNFKAPFHRMVGLLKGEAYAGAALHEVIWALKEVSFEVQPGEVLGIIGRNGAGKTTLLKVLCRITEPTEGYADVWGRVGSLLEVGTGFHPELTGRENIYLNGAVLGMRKREIDEKFSQIVEFAEFERFLDTPVKHYSAGMQTRLAFSIAAHLEPEILLVDEVLAVGDISFQKKCIGKMGEVSESGRTVLFVSHQMNQIRRLCERCIWLNEGRIEMDGPAAQTIGAYEASAATMALDRKRHAEGLPHISARFLSWEIVNTEEEQKNMLTTLGPMAFKMVVEANKPIRSGHHGIALWNMDNQLMWAWAVDNLKLAPGLHEFIYEIPSLPLKPGVYTWHVSLYDEENLLDQWHCTPELIISTDPLTHRLDKWTGVLNVPCEFRTGLIGEKRDD